MTDTLRRPAEETSRPDMDAIMGEYGGQIYRLCLLYLGSPALAEDAFQETMIKCWRHYDSFRGDSSLGTWLGHIAVNTCRDALRSRWFGLWKRSEPIEGLFGAESGEELPDTGVRDAVAALPGVYREVIVLAFYENMTNKEIAELLHLSKNTVSTRLRRGKARLSKMLKEDDDDA